MKWLIKIYLILIILKQSINQSCEYVSELPKDLDHLVPYYEFMSKLHYRNFFYLDFDRESLEIKFVVKSEKVFK
jgi:hypothetical protein